MYDLDQYTDETFGCEDTGIDIVPEEQEDHDARDLYPDELAMEEAEMPYNDCSFEGCFEGTKEV